MCNLSTGLIEKGLRKGRQQGRQEGRREGYAEGVQEKGVQIYRNMLKRGFSEEEALSLAEITREDVKKFLESKK